jgi:hypothetical protein
MIVKTKSAIDIIITTMIIIIFIIIIITISFFATGDADGDCERALAFFFFCQFDIASQMMNFTIVLFCS